MFDKLDIDAECLIFLKTQAKETLENPNIHSHRNSYSNVKIELIMENPIRNVYKSCCVHLQ